MENIEKIIKLENARLGLFQAVKYQDPKTSQYLEAYIGASDEVYKAPVGWGQVPRSDAPRSKGWGSIV